VHVSKHLTPCDTESTLTKSCVLRNTSEHPKELPTARIEKERSNMKILKETETEQLEQQVAKIGIEKVRKKYESGDLAML